MKRAEQIRKQLEQRLLKQKASLYSYDLSKPHQEKLVDVFIIKKHLQFGNKHHWEKLKLVFPVNQIRKVWPQNFVPGNLNESKNEQIAKYLFNVSDPSKYIKRKQIEHLRYLIKL